MLFAWDPQKRQQNIAKHGVDLLRGMDLFDGRAVFTYKSPRGEEDRQVTVGPVDGVLLALVWVARGAETRLISLRRARNAERNAFAVRNG
jgi:uncharacterized DUF497 family protein